MKKGWAGQKVVGVDASNLTHASIISCLLKCYKPGGNAVSWIVWGQWNWHKDSLNPRLQNHNLVSARKERTDDTDNSQQEGGGESEEYEWITKTMSYYVLAEVPKMGRMESLGSTRSRHVACGCETPSWTQSLSSQTSFSGAR